MVWLCRVSRYDNRVKQDSQEKSDVNMIIHAPYLHSDSYVSFRNELKKSLHSPRISGWEVVV
jgi:hypothetical protein